MTVSKDDCWIYAGPIYTNGYGKIYIYIRGWRDTSRRAHRVMYENMVGEIPRGYVIDHLCKEKLCINPAHLEAVTSRENTLRSELTIASQHRAKTHCDNGHELSEGNLYPAPDSHPQWRICRKCRGGRVEVAV